LESQADRRNELQEEMDEISENIESLRSRREDIIEEARATFQESMEDIIEVLNPSFEAARLEKQVDAETRETEELNLIIAREGRETDVAALSEGEIELVGIIVALAGYEAFDVAEHIPCILLDEVGGLASDNLHTLVHYLGDRTEYLITTAYPEMGEFSGHTISPAEWNVVSNQKETVI
jgi:DNA repair exonuclease SbcCD ATPase subunit